MKKELVRHQRTIIATTPEEWDAKINSAFIDIPTPLGEEGPPPPEIARTIAQGQFTAVIDWWTYETISETVREEYVLRGECHRCGECVHLLKSKNPRVRYLECDKGMRDTTTYQRDACDYFYEQYEQNKMEIVKKGA